MKQLLLTLFCCLAFFPALAQTKPSFPAQPPTAVNNVGDPAPWKPKLKVIVTNVKRTGVVRIGVYTSKENFKAFKDSYEYHIPVTAGDTAEAVFNLPSGTYAVGCFLDLNNNDDVDLKLGVPVEPWGFSRNPRGLLSVPTWKKCNFNFSRSGYIKIELVDKK